MASSAAFANNAAIKEEYFAPLLIETNAVWRKLCAAMEKLCASLVAIPADQILTVSSTDLATAELRDGADESASHEERTKLMAKVMEQFELIRSLSARLCKALSHMMRIYVLAHHTAGAGWDTVAQLCFLEEWDRKMLAVQDSFTPLKTWEEKVTAIMRPRNKISTCRRKASPLIPSA